MALLQFIYPPPENATESNLVPIPSPVRLVDVCEPSFPDRLAYLMQELTGEDLADLARYAGYRLARVRLDPSEGEDFRQDALLAVLHGAQSISSGRHPRPVDLQNRSAFLDYLKGVIGSLVEAERRRLAHRFSHEPFAESVGYQPAAFYGHPIELEFNDLRIEFFKRLEQRVPGRLSRIVLTWKDQGNDLIPLLGHHRRIRQQLKKLAAQVLRQLINPPTVIPYPTHI
jgi:hypothetical protein